LLRHARPAAAAHGQDGDQGHARGGADAAQQRRQVRPQAHGRRARVLRVRLVARHDVSLCALLHLRHGDAARVGRAARRGRHPAAQGRGHKGHRPGAAHAQEAHD
ncbi:hypothetical protein BN1708_020038, partial [Verticillium longisporum]